MSVIDLSVAVAHLHSEDADADHVQLLLDAAEEKAMQYMCRTFYADESDIPSQEDTSALWGEGIVINAAITAAVLLILGDLFLLREDRLDSPAQGLANIPRVSERLLHPYRFGLGV